MHVDVHYDDCAPFGTGAGFTRNASSIDKQRRQHGRTGLFTILVFDRDYNLIDAKYQQVRHERNWDQTDLNYAAIAMCMRMYRWKMDYLSAGVIFDKIRQTTIRIAHISICEW